ncbi:CRISPR-associated ring nuclease Crn3/Csx3 [Thermofilum sp.]|uniref:CRISPR-associated ring nuclease Crn3/Csx3 n=1 Tax=Thermofilum sp. TaxID=1961369 RepID=UPI00316093F4
MSKIKFNTIEKDEFVIVEFELTEPILPEDLKNIRPPSIKCSKGVVLSGRGPIWLYGFLIHHYHPATFVATNDPRIGAVVVESHAPKYKVGDVINI